MHTFPRRLSRPASSLSRLVKQGVALCPRHFPPARLLLFLFLLSFVSLTALVSPRMAFAGHYVKTYVGGKSTPFDSSYSNPGGDRDNFQSSGLLSDPNHEDPNALGTAAYSGSVSAIFTWTPDSPDDQSARPKCVVIVEQCDVHWKAGPQSDAPTGLAKSDIEHNYFDGSYTDTNGRMPIRYGSGDSHGFRTTVIPNPPATFKTQCSPSAQATGRHASVSVFYSAVVAIYDVMIYSNALESGGNFKKGFGGLRVPNLRNPDGSVTVDSIAFWDTFGTTTGGQDGVAPGWFLEADIQARGVGFSGSVYSTSVDWSNSGLGTIGNDWWQKWSTRLDSELLADTAIPGDTDIKVKVTGSDGATAENTYSIHWHAPYDNWQQNGEPDEVERAGNFVSGKSVFQYPESATGTFLPGSPLLGDWVKDVNGAVSFGAAFTIPNTAWDVLYKGLLSGAIIWANGQGEPVTAGWGDLWGMSNAQFPDGKNLPQERYQMTVNVQEIDKRTPYVGDQYATNGYAGSVLKFPQVYKRHRWVPVFTLIPGVGPPPERW